MNIREAIKRLAENNDEIYLKIGIVTDIDPDRRTCDVTPLDGSAPLLDVKLQAGETGTNALIAWPRRKSHVLVGFINADAGCVLLTHDPERIQATVGENNIDIDEKRIQATAGEKTSLVIQNDSITLNGGKLGGIVNIQDLKTNLDNLKSYCETLKTAITAGFNGIGSAMEASGTKGTAAFNNAIGSKNITIKDMEDKNVKH